MFFLHIPAAMVGAWWNNSLTSVSVLPVFFIFLSNRSTFSKNLMFKGAPLPKKLRHRNWNNYIYTSCIFPNCKICNRKRGKNWEETGETPEKIIEKLGEHTETRWETVGNGWETGETYIEGITIIISQKMKRTVFSNSRLYLIYAKIINILCLNKLKITNWEPY